MKNVSIKRISYEDMASVSNIHVNYNQSRFVSPPSQVMAIIKEVGNEKINIPFSVNFSDKVIGFFTLNFYCPLCVQADPVFFGGKNDCRLESFMIDEKYQGQGFGKRAIKEIIHLLSKKYPHIKGLKLSVNFLNDGAKLFYLNCGFKDSGDLFNGGPSGPQHIYKLDLC